ncbi:MAG: fibronectin type III domain-containing protein [Phycisphaerales bacterium]|nr:fibronectin type III domain-containing protein [Phycisphaerales bacterium]
MFYTGTPNGVMTYQLARAEVYTDPGPIVRGIFADEGWTVQTSTLTPPGVPTAFTTSAVGTTVTMTWRAPATGGTPTAYYIASGSSPGLSDLAYFSTGSTATSFSADRVGLGTYYVRVRAANASGTSPESNESILIVGNGCASPPTQPGTLIGSSLGTTVSLAWDASSGNPTSYIVEAGSGPGLSNLANSDLGSATPALVASNVSRGLCYIRIRGKNGCGVGPASNEVTVIVQ